MKKTFQIIGIAFLTCFSFYYTDKMVELSKNKDPLMLEIVSKQDDFNTYAMESVIYDDYILSGTKGKVVNVKESYIKMKNLGKYNENLYVYKEDVVVVLLLILTVISSVLPVLGLLEVNLGIIRNKTIPIKITISAIANITIIFLFLLLLCPL